MKRIKLVSFVFIVMVAFVFALVGCKNGGSDLDKIKEAGVINVGITIYDPMDYFAEDGETIIGFDADLANEFAKELGVRARFTLIAWDEKVLELNGGYIDLIWNGMTASDELGTKIDFSKAYATNYQCVVVKKGAESGFNSSEDLKGKQVAVEKGSAGDEVISEIVTPNRVNAQLDALNEVKAGTSVAAVIDYTMAYSVVGKGDFTDLVIIAADKISFEQEVFAVGARKGSDIIAKLDEFLQKKYEDNSLQTLATKYGVAINDEAFKK